MQFPGILLQTILPQRRRRENTKPKQKSAHLPPSSLFLRRTAHLSSAPPRTFRHRTAAAQPLSSPLDGDSPVNNCWICESPAIQLTKLAEEATTPNLSGYAKTLGEVEEVDEHLRDKERIVGFLVFQAPFRSCLIAYWAEKDSRRMVNSLQPGKSNPNTMSNAGITSGNIGGESENLSRDRLLYLTACLIGHHVEVQVTNGSVFSGIFHASNADGDFGVVLKMARVTKDVSSRGQRAASDSVSKAPSKTLIIAAHELVQVVAKDVPITSNGQLNELQGGKQREIMLDSYISQSCHFELGRELQPWMPDEDDIQCPELENIFDSPQTGSWDQFKVNETLFGVKSTFNEELYTTKLERGPQMTKLEEEALRIAREIEGEETRDSHLAEERGIYPHGDLDVDEETKYSSVSRDVDEGGYADEDVMLNSYDKHAPKGPAGLAFGRSFADVISGKSSKCVEDGQIQSGSLSKVNEDVRSAESDDSQSLWDPQRDGFEKACLSSAAAKGEHRSGLVEDPSGKVHVAVELVNPHERLGISASSTPDTGVAIPGPTFPPVSPSSSVGSLSSEKSTLNPNAKEFKLNPNARSFIPSQSPLRAVSPVNDGSFYYPAAMPAMPHMQGMPVGMGVGPSFAGHQPMLFNPQAVAMQSPQAYFPANGPQYGQPMILGHPRPVMFMPGYPTN